MPIKFGIRPILGNYELVEKLLHWELATYRVGRELFLTAEETLKKVEERVSMFELRSCKWPACKGYFNHYGKQFVSPTSLEEAAAALNRPCSRLPMAAAEVQG